MTIQEKYHFFSFFLPYGIYCKVEGIAKPLKVVSVHISETDGVILNFGDVTDKKGNLELYLGEVKICLLHHSKITKKEKREFSKWQRNFCKNNVMLTDYDCHIYCSKRHWDWLSLNMERADQFNKVFECEEFVHYLSRREYKKLYG